jgi:large subunit ribosomal protein L18
MRITIKKQSSDRLNSRLVKKMRVRKKISGSGEKPRMSVFKSAKHIYAQLVDDVSGKTLLSSSSLKLDGSDKGVAQAKKVGSEIAKLAKSKNISEVVFDRNGFQYHGRIKALAEGAREAGLKF